LILALLTFVEGPKQEVFELLLVSDNTTVTQVDMGELGGMRDATSEFKDNSLITYLKPQDSQTIDIIALRTIEPESKLKTSALFKHIKEKISSLIFLDPDVMMYTLHHLPSNVKYISWMNKVPA